MKLKTYHGFRPVDLIRRDNTIFSSNTKLTFDFNLKFEQIYMASEYARNYDRYITTEEKSLCPVCISEYEEEKMRKLNCSHFLCSGCYSRVENQCPTCRSFFKFSSTIEILKAFENSSTTYYFD